MSIFRKVLDNWEPLEISRREKRPLLPGTRGTKSGLETWKYKQKFMSVKLHFTINIRTNETRRTTQAI